MSPGRLARFLPLQISEPLRTLLRRQRVGRHGVGDPNENNQALTSTLIKGLAC